MRNPVAVLLGAGAIFILVAILSFATKSPALAEQAASNQPAAEQGPDRTAVERARKQVKMLDNIYKQTIVLITDKYVHDDGDYPAGSAAVLLFKKVSETGSHKVRLLDATGDPYESANVAQDDFERNGVEALKKGKEGFEEIITEDDKHFLRAITPVPVVMDKCIMCHSHYADVEDGDPIGAISYTIPIE